MTKPRAVLLLLLAGAGGIASLLSLIQSWSLRVPLAVLAGGWFRVGLVATALSVVAFALALRSLARSWIGERPRASWLSLRALFSIAVLGGAAFLLSVPEYEVPWIALFGSGCLGLWALFLLVEERAVRAAPRIVRVLEIVLFDLALVLVLIEGSLRLAGRLRPSPLLATSASGPDRLLAHFRQPAGMLRWGFPTNRRGHFDEEFEPKKPGERLVACIGDSFSFSAVPHYWHYTTVCERLLPGTRVDNLGVPGVGPPEYEILLRTEALPLYPDDVVVALFVGNDVSFLGAYDARDGGLLRSWLDRRENLTWTVIGRLARIRADARAGGGGDRVSNGRSRAPARAEDPDELERQYPWMHDPSLEPPGMSEKAFFSIETQRVTELCGGGTAKFAPMFRALEEILHDAGTTPIGVLLLPDEFQVEDGLWARLVSDPSVPGRDRDRPQRVIGEWLEAHRVPFVDILPRFREAPVSTDGSRHLYLLRNTHFNVAGNDIAARCLAELIRKMSG